MTVINLTVALMLLNFSNLGVGLQPEQYEVPPFLLVDGVPAERSVITQEHVCKGQKIKLILNSDYKTMRLVKGKIENRTMSNTQIKEFNNLISVLTVGYAQTYFECTGKGFLLQFTEPGNQIIRIHFNGEKSSVIFRKSIKPPVRK